MTLGRWLGLAALGLSLLVLGALLRGTPEDAGWYVAHVLPGVSVVVFCSLSFGRVVATYSILGYAALLPTLTLIVGLEVMDPFSDGVRVSLFTDNANLLAADLVAVTLAAAALRPKLPWAAWLPIVGLSLLFTGSRAALLGLAVGGLVLLLHPSVGWRARIISLAGVLILAGALAFAQLRAQEDDANPNILHISTTFAANAWNSSYSESVVIDRNSAVGPFPSTQADRLILTPSRRLAIYQGIERSQPGIPYVASVYLKSDTPQNIILSTQLSRVTCKVTTTWERCITPVGMGDGRASAQFRIESTVAGAPLDILAFGPQLERATSASAYSERGATVLYSAVASRLSASRLIAHGDASRVWAVRQGVHAFLRSAWLGIGRLAPIRGPDEVPISTPHVHHSHNLFIEVLARDGVFGLLAWILIAIPPLAAMPKRRRLDLLPWAAAFAVMNTLDVTAFHSGSYFSAAVVIGVLCFGSHGDRGVAA